MILMSPSGYLVHLEFTNQIAAQKIIVLPIENPEA